MSRCAAQSACSCGLYAHADGCMHVRDVGAYVDAHADARAGGSEDAADDDRTYAPACCDANMRVDGILEAHGTRNHAGAADTCSDQRHACHDRASCTSAGLAYSLHVGGAPGTASLPLACCMGSWPCTAAAHCTAAACCAVPGHLRRSTSSPSLHDCLSSCASLAAEE